ncbi:hypothetical protein HYV81_00740 [Candidatus Woesearchaeota archaeon]|nr:hypothetical protein [Candidatus Woesearchaeota archaeon]
MNIESLVSAFTEIKDFVRENPGESSLYAAGIAIGGFFLRQYDPGLFNMVLGAIGASTVYVTIFHPMIESVENNAPDTPEYISNVIEINRMVSTVDRLL